MKQISLLAFVVLLLITVDLTLSMAYANTKYKIYKVANISSKGKLPVRAWPSPKSRVKVSLSAKAKDLVETGKSKIIGKNKWVEITWRDNKGWVNTRYLKKTGVLLHPPQNKSRNIHSVNDRIVKKVPVPVKQQTPVAVIIPKGKDLEQEPPRELGGDRYDQPVIEKVAEVKTAYSPKKVDKILLCSGSSPEPWDIKMDIASQKMQVKLNQGKKWFSMPISYHAWASPNKVRMNLGGNKGRNVVDVNLEKTEACSNGLNNINYPFSVNATINRQFFSGCCQAISK